MKMSEYVKELFETCTDCVSLNSVAKAAAYTATVSFLLNAATPALAEDAKNKEKKDKAVAESKEEKKSIYGCFPDLLGKLREAHAKAREKANSLRGERVDRVNELIDYNEDYRKDMNKRVKEDDRDAKKYEGNDESVEERLKKYAEKTRKQKVQVPLRVLGVPVGNLKKEDLPEEYRGLLDDKNLEITVFDREGDGLASESDYLLIKGKDKAEWKTAFELNDDTYKQNPRLKEVVDAVNRALTKPAPKPAVPDTSGTGTKPVTPGTSAVPVPPNQTAGQSEPSQGNFKLAEFIPFEALGRFNYLLNNDWDRVGEPKEPAITEGDSFLSCILRPDNPRSDLLRNPVLSKELAAEYQKEFGHAIPKKRGD